MRSADDGNQSAAQELFASLYRELHSLAEHQLRRNSAESTLTATSLLHDTYLNLAGRERASFPDKARFMAYASKAMRGLIIDYSRARRAKKRGGEFQITGIGREEPPAPDRAEDEQLDQLGQGLEKLSAIDPGLAQLVDLHFFCGLDFVEIAAMRAVSDRTVQRDWKKARLLLQRLALEE
jgi:RNA polymerase sigma factor (TIGR02999 family)